MEADGGFSNKDRRKILSSTLPVFCLHNYLFSNGCTMCPSPFDYSGTVPGSANQNDFRIRANGILPIWKRPKPWPPIVSFEKEEPRVATAEAIEDTSSVPRVIVASHEEDLQAVRKTVLFLSGT